MIESLSDGIVNLTSGKIRKPDERFEEMREEMERFEYGLAGMEKGAGKVKGRVGGMWNVSLLSIRHKKDFLAVEAFLGDP